MRHYVYSTLTNDYDYTNYKPDNTPGQANKVESHCLIKGGANRATDRLITPLGVCTMVDEDQLAVLERNSTFQKHKKQGFIIVKGDKADADEVAKSMEARDGSAPITPDHAHFKRAESPKPMADGKKKKG